MSILNHIYHKDCSKVEEHSIDTRRLLERHDNHADDDRLQDVRLQQVLVCHGIATQRFLGLTKTLVLRLNIVVFPFNVGKKKPY